MSNLDLMVKIPLPIFQNFRILNKNINRLQSKITIMIEIDEEEENLIDNIDKETLKFERGNKIFSVTMRDIYCYGEVNFTDKETIDKLNSFRFLDYLEGSGIHIYSNYNYESHSCLSPKRFPLWTETWSPAELARYNHGLLGKPKRILLFNQNIKYGNII